MNYNELSLTMHEEHQGKLEVVSKGPGEEPGGFERGLHAGSRGALPENRR